MLEPNISGARTLLTAARDIRRSLAVYPNTRRQGVGAWKEPHIDLELEYPLLKQFTVSLANRFEWVEEFSSQPVTASRSPPSSKSRRRIQRLRSMVRPGRSLRQDVVSALILPTAAHGMRFQGLASGRGRRRRRCLGKPIRVWPGTRSSAKTGATSPVAFHRTWLTVWPVMTCPGQQTFTNMTHTLFRPGRPAHSRRGAGGHAGRGRHLQISTRRLFSGLGRKPLGRTLCQPVGDGGQC